ncbi:hypothetical protein [Microscilla marina]|nr:hypothetical protein [Microscilla marina]
MRIIVIVISWLMVVQFATAQVQITLKPAQFYIASPSFYIKKVVDSRKDKQSIGYTKDVLDEKVAIKLNPEVPKAIQIFVNQSLVPTPQATPIILQVLYLQVKEEQTSNSEITARAEIKLAFYEKEQGKLKKNFSIEHYEDQVFATSAQSRIAGSQEKRIRNLLEHCLKKFAEERKAKRLTAEYVPPKVLSEPSAVHGLAITKNKPLGQWHNLLTFKRSAGLHTQGWRVSYVGFSDREEITVPFMFSLGQSQVKETTINGAEYRVIDAYTFGFGTQVYIKLFSNLYANVALNVPVGLEVLRDRQEKRSHNFLIGVGSKQGLMYIPKSSLGIVVGGSIFQQLQTSRVFSTNWGFELEIGIKF